jgi:phosphoglycolate phosphatase
MRRHYDAVMFDLDGTLADTLSAIAHAGNHALACFGREPIDRVAYRYLAGQGLAWLITEAFGTDDDATVRQGMKDFRDYYDRHANAQTQPYDGIMPLLGALRAADIRMAVLSNKPHDATQTCVAAVLGGEWFERVVGHRPGFDLKPDPASALEIAAEMGIAPDRWLYVGDTRVDMLTARAAGMCAVGVLWGFRDEPELRDSGADHILEHPAQLLDLL